jgi:hypothetical protein
MKPPWPNGRPNASAAGEGLLFLVVALGLDLLLLLYDWLGLFGCVRHRPLNVGAFIVLLFRQP